MVNLRIGSVLRHLFYRKGKPEAPIAGVVKGLRYTNTASPLTPFIAMSTAAASSFAYCLIIGTPPNAIV